MIKAENLLEVIHLPNSGINIDDFNDKKETIIAGTGSCKKCSCTAFASTQGDDICENSRDGGAVCGHSKADHS